MSEHSVTYRNRVNMARDFLTAILVSALILVTSAFPIEDPKQLVREMLEEWRREEVIRIPVVGIDDPYPIEDSFAAGSAVFEENKIAGLTNIHLISVLVQQNQEDMFEAQVEVLIPELVVTGSFKYSSWLSNIEGNYTAKLNGIVAVGGAVPVIDERGMVQLAKIEPDLSYDNVDVEINSNSLWGSVMNLLINSLKDIMFNFIKPTLIQIVNDQGIPFINTQLAEQLTIRFPNSISMIDSLIANERTAKMPSSMELEDIQVGGSISANFHNGYVEGLRTLHRSGPVQFLLRNHTFHILINLGVGYLNGGYDWTVPLWLMEYQGQIDFELEGLSVLVDISQSANIERQPTVNELSISIDAVALALDGTSYGDYLLEFFINVIPNLFKQSFYSAARLPLTAIAHQIAQTITVQDIVDQHL